MWAVVKARLRTKLASSHTHCRWGTEDTNASTRSLSILEIACHIASFVEDRRTLLALALTSRTLSEAALDALWAEGNLWHLAQLMPPHLWTDRVEERVLGVQNAQLHMNRILNFTDAPRTGHWLGKRFLFYSRRVRTIWLRRRDARKLLPTKSSVHPPGWAHLIVHPAVVTAWLEYPKHAVFPRFVDLRIDDVIFREHWSLSQTIAPRLQLACALVHPGLRCISIEAPLMVFSSPPNVAQVEMQNLYSTAAPLFERVAAVSSSLHDLRILGGNRGWPRDTADMVSPILIETERLTTLAIGGRITAGELLHIALLPNLATFHMRGPIDSEFSGIAERSPGALFPSLSELHIVDDALSPIFPRVVSSRRIRVIIVNLWLLPSLELLSRFLAAIEDQKELETLNIVRDTTQPTRGSSTYRSSSVWGLPDILESVRSLPALKTLNISSEDDFDTRDQASHSELALVTAVDSWPRLEQLGIYVGNCRISLDTFGLILQKCPNLVSLHVGVDTSTLPPFPAVKHQKLNFLSVVGKPLSRSSVINYFRAVCPELMDFSVHTSCTFQDIDTVRELSDALFAIKTSRLSIG